MVYCSRLKKRNGQTNCRLVFLKFLYDKQHAQFSTKFDTFKGSKRSYKIHLSHAYLWFIKTRTGGESTTDHHSASTSSSERHWRRLVSFPQSRFHNTQRFASQWPRKEKMLLWGPFVCSAGLFSLQTLFAVGFTAPTGPLFFITCSNTHFHSIKTFISTTQPQMKKFELEMQMID